MWGGVIRILLSFGANGVQGFVFLSGLGIHYSLQNNKKTLSKWYIKRLPKILLPYLMVAIPYWAMWSYINDAGLLGFIKGVCFITFWMDHKGFWFIAAIIPLYLFAPLYDVFYRKVNQKTFFTIAISGLFLIASILNESSGNGLIWNVRWCMGKMAPFFMGYYCWDMIQRNEVINLCKASIVIIAMFVVLSVSPIVGRIGWWWILIFILFGITCLFIQRSNENNFGRKVLRFMGSISLESYMLNVAFVELFKYLRSMSPALEGNVVAVGAYSFIVAIGIVISVPYRAVSHKILRRE